MGHQRPALIKLYMGKGRESKNKEILCNGKLIRKLLLIVIMTDLE